MENNKRRVRSVSIGFCVLMIALILIDQCTKIIAQYKLMGQDEIKIIGDVLVLHYLENTGAAFSMMANVSFFQTIMKILTPILVLIMLYLTYIMIQLGKRYYPLAISVAFIISGALGNYIDRIGRKTHVIDFIYVKIIDFPVFNVADIYVTCSVFILFIQILFIYKDHELDEIKNKFLRK